MLDLKADWALPDSGVLRHLRPAEAGTAHHQRPHALSRRDARIIFTPDDGDIAAVTPTTRDLHSSFA
jgi:hypothetical protein